ncbi:small membrane protein [Klebsiella aerogenes]|nr:small membrane protein [Klebsiella aerogenes]MDG0005275.1 small membrane protein [Klebsiella aerogenes]HEP1062518.1 small membrane protein [Klebsiella aerogenes]
MENLLFLIFAAMLLVVAVFFLFSYIKDRKKNKLTFTKRR